MARASETDPYLGMWDQKGKCKAIDTNSDVVPLEYIMSDYDSGVSSISSTPARVKSGVRFSGISVDEEPVLIIDSKRRMSIEEAGKCIENALEESRDFVMQREEYLEAFRRVRFRKIRAIWSPLD